MTARLSDFDLREGLSDCDLTAGLSDCDLTAGLSDFDLRDFSSCFVKVNITAAAAADKILELEQVYKSRICIRLFIHPC